MAEQAADPTASACWCCGTEVGEQELIGLGAHPEVKICLRCAIWVKRRANLRRHEQNPSWAGHVARGVAGIRAAVMAHGWHRHGRLGTLLRRIDRYLP